MYLQTLTGHLKVRLTYIDMGKWPDCTYILLTNSCTKWQNHSSTKPTAVINQFWLSLLGIISFRMHPINSLCPWHVVFRDWHFVLHRAVQPEQSCNRMWLPERISDGAYGSCSALWGLLAGRAERQRCYADTRQLPAGQRAWGEWVRIPRAQWCLKYNEEKNAPIPAQPWQWLSIIASQQSIYKVFL